MSFVDVPVPHGRLEGLLWKVPSPKGAVVVCHPHPLHGGTMHNHVTYRMADAFRQAGVTALRFNFRGVGLSTGTHDEGRGEVDDAAAALDFLQREEPGVPLLVAGFSFGARTALQLARRDARVGRVLVSGLVVDMTAPELLAVPKPKAIIQGDRDAFGPLSEVEALLERAAPPRALFVVEGSDHLATGQLAAFERVAKEAVAWLLLQERGHAEDPD